MIDSDKAAVNELIAATLDIPVSEINETTPLAGKVDSLDMLDLVFGLDKQFKLDIFTTEINGKHWDANDFATVGDIYRTIDRHKA